MEKVVEQGRELIVQKLLQQGFKKREDYHQMWETFVSGKKKVTVCLLKRNDGKDCVFYTDRLDKAELHAGTKQHGREASKEISTITKIICHRHLVIDKIDTQFKLKYFYLFSLL